MNPKLAKEASLPLPPGPARKDSCSVAERQPGQVAPRRERVSRAPRAARLCAGAVRSKAPPLGPKPLSGREPLFSIHVKGPNVLEQLLQHVL